MADTADTADTAQTAGTAAAGPDYWQTWQDSWDRQQEWYMPDREERFRVMLDMVEALVGPTPGFLISRAVREVSRTASSSGSREPPARASTSTRRC